MSVKSECVMLNKGKFIIKTIQTLENILIRQSGHINKKRYIMRPLAIAKSFFQNIDKSESINEFKIRV